jgi:hypothetical protein
MGFLSIFTAKAPNPQLGKLPSGTFTVDAQCHIVSSTVPQSVPAAQVKEVGAQVLGIFESGRRAQMQFSELVIQYEAFKITARELRGGAIVFMTPRSLQSTSKP